VAAAVVAISEQLKLVRLQSISPHGLLAYQRRRVSNLFRWLETRDSVESLLADSIVLGRMPAPVSALAGGYAGLKVADVAALARTMLAEDRVIVVVAGDRRLLEPGLKAMGPATWIEAPD
jgi:hypothetical protein